MNEMFQLEGTTLRIILPQELDHPIKSLQTLDSFANCWRRF